MLDIAGNGTGGYASSGFLPQQNGRAVLMGVLNWSESDADERDEGCVGKKRSVLHFVVQDVLGTAASNAQQASFCWGEV